MTFKKNFSSKTASTVISTAGQLGCSTGTIFVFVISTAGQLGCSTGTIIMIYLQLLLRI